MRPTSPFPEAGRFLLPIHHLSSYIHLHFYTVGISYPTLGKTLLNYPYVWWVILTERDERTFPENDRIRTIKTNY